MSVEIYYKGNLLVSCYLKDISLCGAGLLTGPLAFLRNSRVKLKFTDFNSTLDSNIINGVVVRNSAHETGIMFTPTNPHMVSSILKHTADTCRQLSVSTPH